MKDNEAVCSCCGRIDNKCFMERIATGHDRCTKHNPGVS